MIGISLRLHEAAALTLTALGLAPGAAHLLELPVKLGYQPELYARVTATLYAWYGIVGGSVQVIALLTLAALALRERRKPTRRLYFAAAGGLLVSLLLWGLLVAPVNLDWAADGDVAHYARLRTHWEFGHVAAFIAWLAAWMGLVTALTGRR